MCRSRRVRLVLGEHADPQVAGVDQVGQHEVDQPVVAAERDGGLGPVGGQRHQPLALAAGQDDARTCGSALTFTIAALDGRARMRSTSRLDPVRVGLLTREYPPDVYGGAGVHVEYLVRGAARARSTSTSHCFGEPRADAGARAFRPPAELAGANAALQTLGVDLEMAAAHRRRRPRALAHLVRQPRRAPRRRCCTASRTWSPRTRSSRCGRGRPSSSAAATACRRGSSAPRTRRADAVIAVSDGMRADVLRRLPGRRPRPGARRPQRHRHRAVPRRPRHRRRSTGYGIDPDRPYVLFVGRITRQKGVGHLLAAAATLRPRRPARAVRRRAGHPGDRRRDGGGGRRRCAATRRPASSGSQEHAAAAGARRSCSRTRTVFVCPSVYEPLGIVNLEAMACETAVVATDVGGIPEVVVDGETGLLVHYDEADPAAFEAGHRRRGQHPRGRPRRGRGRWATPAGRGPSASSPGGDRAADRGRVPRSDRSPPVAVVVAYGLGVRTTNPYATTR